MSAKSKTPGDRTGIPSSSEGRVEEELKGLIERYGALLRRTIAELSPPHLGLDRDDIEQEARLRLWRALRNEKGITAAATYVKRAAASATLDAIRRARSRRRDAMTPAGPDLETEQGPAAAPAGPIATPEAQLQRRRQVEAVQRALDKVKGNRRTATALHLQGFTTAEIARLQGWTEAKARNLAYRGLADLRKRLELEGVGTDTF